MPIRGLLLISFFVASLPVCFFRPFYGIILWTIVAFLNPQSYTWSAIDAFPWALGVAIPTLAGFFIFETGWRRLISRDSAPILILWAWFTVTTVVSTHTPLFMHHAGDTWYRWEFVSKILLMTVVTMAIVDSLERLRILALVIAGSFGFFVLKAFPFLIATGGNYRLYGPEYSMIADNNDFGLALNMTLPFFFFLAQTEQNKWVRRLFAFLFFITIPAIFATYSRGALVGLSVLMLLMFLQVKRRMLLVPVIALGCLVALVFAPEEWKHRMDPTKEDAVDASAQARLNAWGFAWKLAQDFPLSGGGFATFTQELFSRYSPTAAGIHGPHSVYFQLLGEHGFIGLGLYLLMILGCFLNIRRLLKWARLRGDSLIANYANMFWFSMVGFLVSGVFLGRAYFDYLFTIVACVAVLRRIATDISMQEDAADDELDPDSPEIQDHIAAWGNS